MGTLRKPHVPAGTSTRLTCPRFPARRRARTRPRIAGCCGALSGHSGRSDEAQRFARSLMNAFADVDHVVVNAAGCGSAMKEYGELLGGDLRATGFAAKVRDLTEILVELGPVANRRPVPATVAYHEACHLAHAQGVRAQPRTLCSAAFPS